MHQKKKNVYRKHYNKQNSDGTAIQLKQTISLFSLLT